MTAGEIIRYYLRAGDFKNRGELAVYLNVHRKQVSYWQQHNKIPIWHMDILTRDFGDISMEQNTVECGTSAQTSCFSKTTKEVHSSSDGIKLIITAPTMMEYRHALIEELWNIQSILKN